jgi:hypothetical protein
MGILPGVASHELPGTEADRQRENDHARDQRN